MAADDIGTLSTDGGSSDSAAMQDTAPYISTVDDVTDYMADDTSGDDANAHGAGGSDDGQSLSGGDAGGDDGQQGTTEQVPYHKDPAWQRIIKERDEARERAIRAEAIAETMKQKPTTPADGTGDTSPSYKDPAKLSPQELNEWMLENPTDFLANLEAKLTSQIESKLTAKMEQSRTMASVEKTFRDYEAQNEDFRPMWDSGEIRKFMDANPGHNAISAHQMLTAEKRILAAAEKAKAEALEQARKNTAIKQNARVMGAGPASTGRPKGPDKELSDTKSSGGLNAVLARRLASIRRGAST